MDPLRVYFESNHESKGSLNDKFYALSCGVDRFSLFVACGRDDREAVEIIMLAMRFYIFGLTLVLVAIIVCTREIGVAELIVVMIPLVFLIVDIWDQRANLRAHSATDSARVD